MAIGIGIIGYGRQGAGHAKRVRAHEDMELRAVCDGVEASREQAVADNPGVKTYADADAFLQDPDVDIVIVVTPTTSHAPLSIKALEAGKHVVCEKPMCMNAQEAERVREAAERAGRFFCVYQNRRGDEYFTKAKAAIDAGHIGKLRDFKIIRNQWAMGSLTWGSERFRPQWRSERAYGGGMLYDWGGHWIDQALLLHGGRVTDVYAQLFIGKFVEGQDAEDGFRVLLGFEDGAKAHIEFQSGCLGRFDSNGWILSGTKGGYVPGTVYRLEDPERPSTSNVQEIPWNDPPPAFDFWGRFIRAVKTGDEKVLPVPIAESIRVMRVIDAAFASHDSGKRITFETPV